MKKTKNDRALRFYSEVLGLERLHYGLWHEDDPFTLEGLKSAQLRYEDMLISRIPDGVVHVLDVGCGTGVMSSRIKAAGYDIEGLSPDVNQERPYVEKVGAPFHLCRFEDFTGKARFDCIIMSESSQYIKLSLLFHRAFEALKPGGSLMICDYLVNDGAAGVLSKSGHRETAFRDAAKAGGFRLVAEEDITDAAVKTLDLAMDAVRRIKLGFEIATEKSRKRHPRLFALGQWLSRKKVAKAEQQLVLLDSTAFKMHKKYGYFLFQAVTENG